MIAGAGEETGPAILDVPFHRFAHGHDVAEIEVDRVADVTGSSSTALITTPRRPPPACERGDVVGPAILLSAGWSRHFGSDAFPDPSHPYVTAGLAEALAAYGAVVVGIDSVNVDGNPDRPTPDPHGLLAAVIPVIEHVTNFDVLARRARRSPSRPCPRGDRPPHVPVRAYAVIG